MSPNRQANRGSAANLGHGAHGHGAGAEREPCKRCIENAKRQRANQLKKKQTKNGAGQYLSINFDELEAQLRQQDHECEDFVLNKMHPGDINYRDKRLSKMLGVYQDDVNAATTAAAGAPQANKPN